MSGELEVGYRKGFYEYHDCKVFVTQVSAFLGLAYTIAGVISLPLLIIYVPNKFLHDNYIALIPVFGVLSLFFFVFFHIFRNLLNISALSYTVAVLHLTFLGLTLQAIPNWSTNAFIIGTFFLTALANLNTIIFCQTKCLNVSGWIIYLCTTTVMSIAAAAASILMTTLGGLDNCDFMAWAAILAFCIHMYYTIAYQKIILGETEIFASEYIKGTVYMILWMGCRKPPRTTCAMK